MTIVVFLGSGDAFSAGGRFYSSLLVIDGDQVFLVDVGPTTPLALRRVGILPNRISHIFLTHTHGDHIAGLPFLFLEYQHRFHRDSPITIVGAPGTSEYVENITTAMYSSLAKENRRFEVNYQSINEKAYRFALTTARSFPMTHELHSRGFRFEFKGGKILAVTGDTEWNDNILSLSDGADLLVIECSFFDKDVPGHLSFKSLEKNICRLNSQRIVLYHLGQDVLDKESELHIEIAKDFMELKF